MKLKVTECSPSSWVRHSIAHVCIRFTSGGTPSRRRAEFYKHGTIPWVKSKELHDGFICDTEEKITTEAIQASSAKLLPDQTILMAMYGATVGQLGRLSIPMACNQACAAMIINPKIASANYLYYQLLVHRDQIVSFATGAAQQNLSGAQIKEFVLPFPPLEEQRQIGNILRVLDDKIELNRRMNETLEAMARAIFKDWFVDFGPTRAKAEGHEPYLAPELWELFPGALDEEGKPVGWRKNNLGELFNVSIGRTPPRKEDQHFVAGGSGRTWLSIKGMGSIQTFALGSEEDLTSHAVKQFRVPLIPAGTVVVSFKLTVGRVAIAAKDMHSNEAIAHLVESSKTPVANVFAYCFLKDFDYGTLSSTSSIATAVNSKTIKAIEMIVPDAAMHSAFAVIVRPFFDQILCNLRENDTLSGIRDLLLPKLMSGEARIPDAERVAEEST